VDALARLACALHKRPTIMKLSSFLSYSLLSATLFAAACGGDSASFKDATAAQRERAIAAGAGADAAMGFFYASFLSIIPPESQCPKVTVSGDTLTATTDCTDENGDVLKGTITAQNVPGFFGGPETDPSKPQIVTFDGFSIDDTSDENEDFSFDGKVTVEVGGQALVVDLKATLNGIEAETDATFRSNADQTMTSADDGSVISGAGLGEADIKGAWNMSTESPLGALELHGDDVLKAEFGNVANGCVPLTIGGEKVGELCEANEAE
jgi:hypothetical protein